MSYRYKRPRSAGQMDGHPHRYPPRHQSNISSPVSRSPTYRQQGPVFETPQSSNMHHRQFIPRHALSNLRRNALHTPVQRYTSGEHQRGVNMQCAVLEQQLKKDLRLSSGTDEDSESSVHPHEAITIRKKIEGAQSDGGFDHLWTRLVRSKDNEIKDILIEILSRLTGQEHVDVGLMKPETFKTFSRIVGKQLRWHQSYVCQVEI